MTMQDATIYVLGSSIGLLVGLFICHWLLGDGWAFHLVGFLVLLLALRGCVEPFFHPVR